jgi:hypothetical protein
MLLCPFERGYHDRRVAMVKVMERRFEIAMTEDGLHYAQIVSRVFVYPYRCCAPEVVRHDSPVDA